MELDPSFYLEGHKNKWKISTRRRNQKPNDPSHWFVVDNDYVDM
jgi:hypothetical protein